MRRFKTASAMMQEWEEASKRIHTEAEIRSEAIRDFAEEIKDYIMEHRSFEEGITTEEIDLILYEFEEGRRMGSKDYQGGFEDGFKEGIKMGEAEKGSIIEECKYLLTCGMGKKKSLEHLIRILEKEQK